MRLWMLSSKGKLKKVSVNKTLLSKSTSRCDKKYFYYCYFFNVE